MGLEIHPGSLGVTGVKRSFSPKMLFLLQITWFGHIDQLDTLIHYGSRNSASLGVTGVKRYQKCYFSFRLHRMAKSARYPLQKLLV